LKKATDLARNIITRYGMSEHLVPRIYGEKEELVFLGRDIREQRNYSEKVAEVIDKEIDYLISEAIKTATNIISNDKVRLEKIVKHLLEHETLEQDEFVKLVGEKKEQSKEKNTEPTK